MARRLRFENQCDRYHDAIDGVMARIAAACDIQLHHLAKAHGEYVFDIVDLASKRDGWRIVFFDDSDQQNALAYHSVDVYGKPYSRVFAGTVLDHGGALLDGAFSVSAAASHEIVEMVGDPACNRWCDDGTGTTLWAFELADATENDAYLIDGVAVSNFLYPDYFNPFGAGQRLDYMQVVPTPFAIRPGGYAIGWNENGTFEEFGRDYPAARRSLKESPGARTFARMYG